ncbi:50S ribosomal protein L30 [Candidatus Woesearchaeota archaeon]|jgi:ribosomal protein L30E|nr:50S ribosomal protein L30 [Candidatus Woesearchaeota archaeon]MBT4387846.1 50S ribosomal protein L30 [Candidatus Woesearchaeota archaeon]MBT4595665.1 50S ribosomal protein L30 [Candidatus Woesearchaeota archaeon]MBT5740852.1 50S ribosomal protein L30 [Candidatus Woesearchaeota archaeon]MBT6505601.1 50S ribosomal protein L30 [Candidatus Woesearchaeota archaeon]
MVNIDLFKGELKKSVESNKLNIGSKTTKKLIQNSLIEKVYMSKNIDLNIKSDIEHFCKIGNINFENLDIDSSELGILCKKNFNITVISFKK